MSRVEHLLMMWLTSLFIKVFWCMVHWGHAALVLLTVWVILWGKLVFNHGCHSVWSKMINYSSLCAIARYLCYLWEISRCSDCFFNMDAGACCVMKNAVSLSPPTNSHWRRILKWVQSVPLSILPSRMISQKCLDWFSKVWQLWTFFV